ncbi:MAG: hypothetical protein QXY45_03920 [Candidatus Aenigmatarchaeota archaeon]
MADNSRGGLYRTFRKLLDGMNSFLYPYPSEYEAALDRINSTYGERVGQIRSQRKIKEEIENYRRRRGWYYRKGRIEKRPSGEEIRINRGDLTPLNQQRRREVIKDLNLEQYGNMIREERLRRDDALRELEYRRAMGQISDRRRSRLGGLFSTLGTLNHYIGIVLGSIDILRRFYGIYVDLQTRRRMEDVYNRTQELPSIEEVYGMTPEQIADLYRRISQLEEKVEGLLPILNRISSYLSENRPESQTETQEPEPTEESPEPPQRKPIPAPALAVISILSLGSLFLINKTTSYLTRPKTPNLLLIPLLALFLIFLYLLFRLRRK